MKGLTMQIIAHVFYYSEAMNVITSVVPGRGGVFHVKCGLAFRAKA
jgi:uncharacterized protein (DUF779 family)